MVPKTDRVPDPGARLMTTIGWLWPPTSFQFVTAPEKIFARSARLIAATFSLNGPLLAIAAKPTTATL